MLGKKGSDAIAVINKIPIVEQEFQLVLNANLQKYKQELQSEYALSPDIDILTVDIEGKTGEDLIKEKALNDCYLIKLQQKQGCDLGVIDTMDFEKIKENMQKENEERADKIKNNELVFGLTEFAMDQYYFYTLNNMILRSKELLLKDKLSISEEDITSYYEEYKNELFYNMDTLEISVYEAAFTEKDREEAEKEIKAIREQLLIQKEPDTSIEKHVYTLSEEEFRYMDKEYSSFNDRIKNLKQGEITEVLEEQGSFVLVKCDRREEGGTKELDQEVKTWIINAMLDERYMQMIQLEREQAKIKVNKKNFEECKVQQ